MASSFVSQFLSFVPGLRLVDGGDLLALTNSIGSYTNGITAGVTATLALATQLTATFNSVDTSTNSGTDGVILPPALPGMEIEIDNNTANTIYVWGVGANQNNGGAADLIIASGSYGNGNAAAHVALASTKASSYQCFTAGIWKQMISG